MGVGKTGKLLRFGLVLAGKSSDFPGGSDGSAACLQCGDLFDPWLKIPEKENGNYPVFGCLWKIPWTGVEPEA